MRIELGAVVVAAPSDRDWHPLDISFIAEVEREPGPEVDRLVLYRTGKRWLVQDDRGQPFDVGVKALIKEIRGHMVLRRHKLKHGP
jgi:hypothetical protein